MQERAVGGPYRMHRLSWSNAGRGWADTPAGPVLRILWQGVAFDIVGLVQTRKRAVSYLEA